MTSVIINQPWDLFTYVVLVKLLQQGVQGGNLIKSVRRKLVFYTVILLYQGCKHNVEVKFAAFNGKMSGVAIRIKENSDYMFSFRTNITSDNLF